MHCALWTQCLDSLEQTLPSQVYNTWVAPLHAVDDGSHLRLLAPNSYVCEWVEGNLVEQIEKIAAQPPGARSVRVLVQVGSHEPRRCETHGALAVSAAAAQMPRGGNDHRAAVTPDGPDGPQATGLRQSFTFDNFVEGKSNQLARAAAAQVAENSGGAYNPLFVYGGVGLGKTHLMHAIGNEVLRLSPRARVLYLHSERFVADMISALRHNAMEDFKSFYRSLDVLLIDDIQFFAKKEKSQEEFFHTFNALLEGQQQVVITCDSFAKEVKGLDERLKSRFGWGLQVAIDPPELETRAAILQSKAVTLEVELPADVAMFIAQRIRGNVRELEGALRRVVAHATFHEHPITLDLTREALRDLIAVHDKNVSPENIKSTVAQFFKLRIADMTSKRRTRSVARPRQVAMSLTKELTHLSLPEIGEAFGGRDHTTVLHACRQIAKLREEDAIMREEYDQLLRMLNA